jgi:hypothetical protein
MARTGIRAEAADRARARDMVERGAIARLKLGGEANQSEEAPGRIVVAAVVAGG